MAKNFTDNQVENILRSYPILKSQAAIDAEKLYGLFPAMVASYDGMPHGSGVSNQTESLGLKRAELDPQIKYKKARAIELACDALTKDCKELVELYYFQKLKKYEVQYKLCISNNQFRERRRITIDTVDEVLTETKNHTKTTPKPH